MSPYLHLHAHCEIFPFSDPWMEEISVLKKTVALPEAGRQTETKYIQCDHETP